MTSLRPSRFRRERGGGRSRQGERGRDGKQKRKGREGEKEAGKEREKREELGQDWVRDRRGGGWKGKEGKGGAGNDKQWGERRTKFYYCEKVRGLRKVLQVKVKVGPVGSNHTRRQKGT